MRKYEDTYKHKGMRHQLVVQLRHKGITDENVLHAIEHIPRHFFLDSAFEKIAYEDRAFPIAEGQTISQPYTVAYQTQLLNVRRNDKVLEIGTGSAYQAIVLAEMGEEFIQLNDQKRLYEQNKDFILRPKYPNIKFFYGDGFEGLPSFAPFDKILVTAAAPFIPPKLIGANASWRLNGIPLDEDGRQRMLRLTKNDSGTITEEYFDYFSFVPMLGGKKE